MDDDKTLFEKVTEKVKSVASAMVDAASDATARRIETSAGRMTPDVEHLAGTSNEQLHVPEATDATAVPPPLFVSPPKAPKKRAAPRVKKRNAKSLKAAKKAPPKTAKRTSKKAAVKKTAKKVKKAVKKTPKKSEKTVKGKKSRAVAGVVKT